MQLQGNFKAFLAGASVFVVGQLAASTLSAQAGESSGGGAIANTIWLLLQFSSYIVAIIAGAVAAFYAVKQPIRTGVLAIALGTFTLLLLAIIMGRQGAFPAIMALLMFSFFAWLGAIFGAYLRKKSGA